MSLFEEWANQVLDFARYYYIKRRIRILLVTSGFFTVLLSGLILVAAILPLYTYSGGYIQGHVGLSSYHILVFGKPVRIAVLDSIKSLVFALYLGSVLAAALVLPSIYYGFRGGRVPRIALEAGVAAYIIEGLTAALASSFIRVLLWDIIPRIPRGGTVPTRFGYLALAQSKAWYTEAGLYAIKLRLYAPIAAVVLVVIAAALYYYIQRYYEDLVEYCLCSGHTS